MSERAEAGDDGQPERATGGGTRVLHWFGMLGAIALGLAGLVWVLKLAGRG